MLRFTFAVGLLGAIGFAAPQIPPLSQAVPAPPAAFEVASIKPNTSGDPGAEMYPAKSEIRLKNYSVKQLIQMAYQVKDYSFAGPSWLDAQRFDIDAKLPSGAGSAQIPAMMQTLLRDRFKLVVHREPKMMTALALVVDKNGLKIKPVEAGVGGTTVGTTMVKGAKISMTQLADLLSSVLNRPVKNLTALQEAYDIDLKWLPDNAPSVDAPGADGRSPTTRGPATSVFAAVQDIGLKLQAQKLPIEVLVVDHAERPSEN